MLLTMLYTLYIHYTRYLHYGINTNIYIDSILYMMLTLLYKLSEHFIWYKHFYAHCFNSLYDIYIHC